MIIERIYGLLAVLINCKYEDTLSWFQAHDGMWILAFLLKMVPRHAHKSTAVDSIEERKNITEHFGANLFNGCGSDSDWLHCPICAKIV
jgi:hypothetical protein